LEKIQIIENLLYILLQYLFLVPPVLYLVFYKTLGKELKIITLICYCVSVFTFFQIEESVPSKFRYALFTLIEYGFFSTLIYQHLGQKKHKAILLILSVAFLIFHTAYFFYGHKRRIDSIPIGIESILVFVHIILFLSEQIKNTGEKPIYSNYFFWISVGIIIYLGGSFFIYILANTISYSELEKYWPFTYVVEIIKNILIIISIFIYVKNLEKKEPPNNVPNLDII
jgi:hypothetical protein